MIRTVYDLGLAAPGLLAYRLFGRFNEKARGFFEIRESLFEDLDRSLEEVGDGPRIIFHVASVGEMLQAMPVMRELSRHKPKPVIIVTHTSVSLRNNMPGSIPADIVTASPFDTRHDVARFLDLVGPSLIVFTSYDLWPNFVWEAAGRVIPMVLINASLPENSGRLSRGSRWFHRMLYSRLSAVGAITKEDAARHTLLGTPPDKIMVTGNCRFDQTLERARDVRSDDPDLALAPGWKTTIVAGSTWPEDHERLLPALLSVMKRHQEVGLIIAPHEPGKQHVSEIEDYLGEREIQSVRYSQLKQGVSAEGARTLIVDALGVLYKLYCKGNLAYIGGGFRQGVHNVMEPAAFSLPVIIGPVHQNSAEALEMIRRGGAFAASDRASLERTLEDLVEHRGKRIKAGETARETVVRAAGATGRTMDLIREHLPEKLL